MFDYDPAKRISAKVTVRGQPGGTFLPQKRVALAAPTQHVTPSQDALEHPYFDDLNRVEMDALENPELL